MHQLLFENAAGIIGVSTPIKTEYEKRHGQSITMIPSMLPYNTTQKSRETLRRKYGFESCDIVILFLGSVKSIKGPDLLLKAFQSFGKRYIRSKKIKLLYSGDGPLRKPLKKDAVAAGIENHVIFLGNIPHENVCELYKLSDIYVLPSLMEARPLSLSEALYNGLPSIGSDIPTISNIISDNCNGLIFLKNNWKDLKHRLELLIEDSGLRTKLGEQAKKSYRKIYKFDTMIEEYCRFYKSIL
jgi:glycosyltransferase involved in cell wall biosynthesis